MSTDAVLPDLGYDPMTDTYHVDYSRHHETPSEAVLTAVAAAIGRSPHSFDPPLAAVVNPEALNDLFAPRHDGARRGSGVIHFRFHGCLVTVHSDGRIAVSPTRPSDSLR